MHYTPKIITLAVLDVLVSLSLFAQPPRPSGTWRALPAAIRPNLRAIVPPALDSSPFIRDMVNIVSSDSMLRTIQDLQDFGTRYEYTRQRDQAAEYLLERLRTLGYEAGSDWYAVGLTDLYDLAHAGSDSIWAVTLKGNILRSTDRGATWQVLLTLPEKEPLYGLAFLSSTEGWACSYWGNLYRTRDGGASWTKTEMQGKPRLWDIAFLPNGVVLLCGEKGALYRKENDSQDWQKITLNTTDAFWNLHVYDDDHIWLCSYYGALFFSHDRGKSWVSRLRNSSYRLNAVSFVSPAEGWAAGEAGLILHTVDGGVVWEALDTNLPADVQPRDLKMSDRQHGYLVTLRGQILATSDGGRRWVEEFSLLNLGWGPYLYQIDRTQDGSWIACGSRGVLLIKSEGDDWTSRTEHLPDSLIHLSRNIWAARQGVMTPEQEVVMVAHYDSYSDDPYTSAPGANDNASGTSAVLEAARLGRDFEFGATLKLLLVSGEELGMLGSTHYVLQARAEKRGIRAAVNGDMIGYPLTGNPARLIAGSYLTRNRLIDSVMVYNVRYGIGATLDVEVDSSGASDYGPFAAAGYDALNFAEGSAEEIWGGLDPYYHKTVDSIDKLSPGLLLKGAQIMLAAAAEIAGVVGRTSITSPPLSTPENFSLAQNYPNPFNATTRIDFRLPRPGKVTLKIYDARGREVTVLLARHLGAGSHSVHWNALGQPSGTYFCRLVSDSWSGEIRLVLLR
jgi:photosystem II stability/assembly factor-like uncharacterized protein